MGKDMEKAECGPTGAGRGFVQARVVVAGLRGGSGKTTLSLGLTAALRARGLAVAPFKKGPDYIDAGWLARASGRDCHSLDPYMIGERAIKDSFVRHACGADISIIEGNRGLFDGMDAGGSMSTSSVARMLRAPVILIVDCTKRTRTTAAVVLGAKKFERGVEIAGVVLNRISGGRHESVTREAIERYTGVPVLGAFPSMKDAELSERHLGLLTDVEHAGADEAIVRLADMAGRHLDLHRVLEIARGARPLRARIAAQQAPIAKTWRAGVLRDAAFQFYYPENIEALEAAGAEIIEIDALHAGGLPDIEMLYIGGGFPETHAARLGANEALRRDVRERAEAGLRIYAECGGLMFLGDSIETGDEVHAMCGVLPLRFKMYRKPRAHGYAEFRVEGENPFYEVGAVIRGHEFHYSEAERIAGDARAVRYVFKMERGVGIEGGMDGIVYKNVLGTYTHVHALGTPEWGRFGG